MEKAEIKTVNTAVESAKSFIAGGFGGVAAVVVGVDLVPPP